MENTMNQFVEILKNNPDKAYDFIANNAHMFSKYELVDIIKELLYGIYSEAKYGLIVMEDHDKILANTADGLADIYEEETEA